MGRIPDSLVRLFTVLVVLVASVVVLRFSVLPASLTDRELHKRQTIERELAKETRFAGSRMCADCHDEEHNLILQGYHATLFCETCHGPAQQHIDDFENKPTAPRERKFCPTCHTYDPARPTGFPQINPVAHNPMDPCITCHDPHNPTPPETPRECGACHQEIARTKAVSHHVNLECTTCHSAPEGHKLSPREVRATKPARREFCGSCHGEDSRVVGTPKIDLTTHGDRYLCWQCHYPHLPEG